MKPSKSFVARFLVRGSLRYTRTCLKNCIKTLVGRKPYFPAKDIFFRQYLLHILGIQPIDKITSVSWTHEGAASQALLMMMAINLARRCGLTYVHTPFAKIAHADRPMEQWVAAWEGHFNLGAGEQLAEVDGSRAVNFALNLDDICELFGAQDLGRMFNVTAPEFRRKYYLNKSPRKTDELTVAVHVRRGDVDPDHIQYYTSNEAVLTTMGQVKSVLDSRGVKYNINLYSQGTRAEFAELALPGVEFFLDADPLWTMQELVEADVLVMARGCFSYYAALVSDGVKIGPPGGWYLLPQLDDVITCSSDGSFDSALFEHQLTALIESHKPHSKSCL